MSGLSPRVVMGTDAQAYEGYVVKGDEMETGTAVPVECRFQEAMFAVGVWVFWLLFIVATIDRAPKHVSITRFNKIFQGRVARLVSRFTL